jgi:hypothetical protein
MFFNKKFSSGKFSHYFHLIKLIIIIIIIQFHDNGCENCEFLNMRGNTARIHEVCFYISKIVI